MEHDKKREPITWDDIDKAMNLLYGGWEDVSASSIEYLNDVFTDDDFAETYRGVREREMEGREILLKFDQDYPEKLKGDMIGEIIKLAREKENE